MNAGATSERVYTGLKRRILDREFRPGDRLDPAALADVLLSSVTPVRDALHRLAGERLVEARTSEGFHLPLVDTPGLRDLYRWNAEVLALALRSSRPTAADVPLLRPAADGIGAVADATAAAFTAIAARSTNLEHRLAVASANDRLHAVRNAEAKAMTGLDDELHTLLDAIEASENAKLRGALSAYHRRRHRHADDIVWTLYRNGGLR